MTTARSILCGTIPITSNDATHRVGHHQSQRINNKVGSSICCGNQKGSFPHKPVVTKLGDKENANPSRIELSKQVRFDEDSNELHFPDCCARLLDEETCQELWYSHAELKDFKNELNIYVKAIRRVDKQRSDPLTLAPCLWKVYDSCCASPEENDTDDDGAWPSLADSSTRDILDRCMCVGDRWGLEKRIVKAISWDVSRRKHQLHKIVRQTQQLHHVDPVVRGAYMSKACQIVSRPSRIYAQRVAASQAASLVA